MNVKLQYGSRLAEACSRALVGMCSVHPDGDYYHQSPERMFVSKNELKEHMEEQWEVTNAEQLKAHIEWRLREGFRHQFEENYLRIACVPEASRAEYIRDLHEGSLERYRFEMISRFVNRMPPAGIAAHDYIFSLYYVYAGHRLKWLTDEEKKQYSLRILQALQAVYTNWRDVVTGFFVGVAFMDKGVYSRMFDKYSLIVVKLLTSRRSPFRKISLWS
ncbi:DUF1266 domain-containing protein [Paenibacillus massiliensis]|uniref:DUF1266 domain-containing protein n=1 Tax=Paenibacillus massiliensis TaxID=225917 RepID=UPI00046F0137|nr:DUF1266 domain-containing protein [Paenibacillus massiliensis]